MLYRKISEGYVIQTFNDLGECVQQKFVAQGEVTYEEESGYEINIVNMPLSGNEYHPFDMVQPNV